MPNERADNSNRIIRTLTGETRVPVGLVGGVLVVLVAALIWIFNVGALSRSNCRRIDELKEDNREALRRIETDVREIREILINDRKPSKP